MDRKKISHYFLWKDLEDNCSPVHKFGVDNVSPNTFKAIVEESECKAIEALTTRDPRFLEMVRDTHLTPGGREEVA